MTFHFDSYSKEELQNAILCLMDSEEAKNAYLEKPGYELALFILTDFELQKEFLEYLPVWEYRVLKPRSKLQNEDEKYTLLRRLEEYMEFAYNTKNFSNLGFYETLWKYIERN